jgi:hypothetical protein
MGFPVTLQDIPLAFIKAVVWLRAVCERAGKCGETFLASGPRPARIFGMQPANPGQQASRPSPHESSSTA